MNVSHTFFCSIDVRDSELDAQGIVNNASYFVYMEHCRHQHLKTMGLDFYEIQQQGIDLILRNCCLQFKAPLKSGDQCVVSSKFTLHNRYRIHVKQTIVRTSDQRKIASGEFTVTGINRNTSKLVLPEALIQALSKNSHNECER